MSDIIDEIDALVDDQMAGGEPWNGFDAGDPDYPRCPHCNRHFHGLPITERIARMYSIGRYDPEYLCAEDDSPVLCHGSTFIGPQQYPPIGWHQQFVTHIIVVPDFQGFVDGMRAALQQFADNIAPMMTAAAESARLILDEVDWSDWYPVMHRPLTATQAQMPACLRTADIKFGSQNWHYELQAAMTRIPQFPVPYFRQVAPLQAAIRNLWDEFNAPAFPVPPRPGFDFSAWATDNSPRTGPEHHHGWDALRSAQRRRPTAGRRNGSRSRG